MDIRFYQIDGDFYKKAKTIEKEKQAALKVVTEMHKEILAGRQQLDVDYYSAYVKLMDAESKSVRLYLDVLKESHDKFVSEANALSIVSMDDAKRLNEKAKDVFAQYGAMCENLEINKNIFRGIVNEYYKGSTMKMDDIHAAYAKAFMDHTLGREKIDTFKDEVLIPCAERCDQFVEDLKYINDEYEAPSDDDFDDDDEMK